MTGGAAPDEKIIREVLRGDIEGYRIIVDRYRKKIFSLGMRFFKNREEANDFAQEVFLKAYGNLGSYKSLAPFRFWLARLAYNLGIDRIGSLGGECIISDSIPSSGDGPEEEHVKNELRDAVCGAMDRLPEKYRICIDLYFYMGLAYSEISEITGMPVNTIKSNVLRAKVKLRDMLRGTIAEDYEKL